MPIGRAKLRILPNTLSMISNDFRDADSMKAPEIRSAITVIIVPGK
jgi:hypothetical protein